MWIGHDSLPVEKSKRNVRPYGRQKVSRSNAVSNSAKPPSAADERRRLGSEGQTTPGDAASAINSASRVTSALRSFDTGHPAFAVADKR